MTEQILQAILAYALEHLEAHVDNMTGAVNMTELEEDVVDSFDIDDDEAAEADLSFKLFEHVRKSGKVRESGPDLILTA